MRKTIVFIVLGLMVQGMAWAAPALLWEVPIEGKDPQLFASGAFLLVRTDNAATFISWEASAIDQPTVRGFEGEYDGEFRTSSPDGSLQIRINPAKNSLTITKDVEVTQLELSAYQGRPTRALVGPEGDSLVLYRVGKTQAEEFPFFHWVNTKGTPIVTWRHSRPSPEPEVFFSARESYVAIVDEDMVTVLNRGGMVQNYSQVNSPRTFTEPQVFINETSRSVVLINAGKESWGQGWDMAGRKLFDVNLPSFVTWHYTHGAPYMIGVRQQGGGPVVLNLVSGEFSELEGMGEVQQAASSPDGKLLAVLKKGRLEAYMMSP